MIFSDWHEFDLFNSKVAHVFDGIYFIDVGPISFPKQFFWKFDMKTESSDREQMVIADDYTSNYYMRMNSSPYQLRLWIGDGTTIDFDSPASLIDNEWHSIEIGCDSSWYIKVDGDYGVVTADESQLPFEGVSNLAIGTRNERDRFFIGEMRNINLNNQFKA